MEALTEIERTGGNSGRAGHDSTVFSDTESSCMGENDEFGEDEDMGPFTPGSSVADGPSGLPNPDAVRLAAEANGHVLTWIESLRRDDESDTASIHDLTTRWRHLNDGERDKHFRDIFRCLKLDGTVEAIGIPLTNLDPWLISLQRAGFWEINTSYYMGPGGQAMAHLAGRKPHKPQTTYWEMQDYGELGVSFSRERFLHEAVEDVLNQPSRAAEIRSIIGTDDILGASFELRLFDRRRKRAKGNVTKTFRQYMNRMMGEDTGEVEILDDITRLLIEAPAQSECVEAVQATAIASYILEHAGAEKIPQSEVARQVTANINLGAV